MSEKHYPCERNTERIDSLIKSCSNIKEEIEKMESKIDKNSDIKISVNTIAVTLEHLVEHNKKQDILSERQNETLDRINENLNGLNYKIAKLETGQKRLNERVDESEARQNINVVEVTKAILLRVVMPASITAAIITALSKLN